jgi:co-chaperonin GroES (HSP10)
MTVNAALEVNNDEIGEVLAELGVKSIRPLRRTLFVRTRPIEVVSPGGIILPQSATGFYAGPAHLRMLRALVLAAGPECMDAVAGDTILFQRVHFARWEEIDRGEEASSGGTCWEREGRSFVGWIDEENIIGMEGDG